MHISEGRLGDGDPLNRKINRALQQAGGGPALAGGSIGLQTQMYNADVLGFRSLDAPLLAEVLALTEQLYRLYPKHVMEQLAFSVVWAQAGPVREAAPWVHHYWDLKEIRPVLAELFALAPAHQLVDLQVRATSINLPALAEGKAQFRALPGWRRAAQRWLGSAWQLPNELLTIASEGRHKEVPKSLGVGDFNTLAIRKKATLLARKTILLACSSCVSPLHDRNSVTSIATSSTYVQRFARSKVYYFIKSTPCIL